MSGGPPRQIPGATDGMKIGGDADKEMMLAVAITEVASGFCGACRESLLRWWKYCPLCGTKVDWDV